jgi:hypothetical protein
MTMKWQELRFRWAKETVKTEVLKEVAKTSFFNLKSKAEGARQIGYQVLITKFVGAAGEVVFEVEYQTTLAGERYQSSKRTFYATEAEAKAGMAKTVKGALKRYEKLAAEGKSKIEKREAA